MYASDEVRSVSLLRAALTSIVQNILFFETSALANNPPVTTVFNKLTASMKQVKKYLPAHPPLQPPLLSPRTQSDDGDQKCCILM